MQYPPTRDYRHGVFQVNYSAVYQRTALWRLVLFETSCAVALPRPTLHFSATFQTGLRYIVIADIYLILLLYLSLNRITLNWSWGTLLTFWNTSYSPVLIRSPLTLVAHVETRDRRLTHFKSIICVTPWVIRKQWARTKIFGILS